MNELIEKIYRDRRVEGQGGEMHELHSGIDRAEGAFLTSIIEGDPSIKKTLEVGCAYGLSSLFICDTLNGREGAHHTIIDPFQKTEWDGVGLKNLEKAGFDFYTLIETRSEFALPQLLERGEEQFDLIFIDGFHTFDHTLLDCFYATRLLRVGGVLVLDDVGFASVKRVVGFLKTYPCYEEISSIGYDPPKMLKRTVAGILSVPLSPETWGKVVSARLYRKIFDLQKIEMVALRKVSQDERDSNWHVEAF